MSELHTHSARAGSPCHGGCHAGVSRGRAIRPEPHMPSRSVCRTMIVAVALVGFASGASAADHFLTIGGGDGPSHNQVSLEKNVLYFQHVLSDFGVAPAAHDIFFSCGPEGRRAVQYRAASVPKVNMLLADVLG